MPLLLIKYCDSLSIKNYQICMFSRTKESAYNYQWQKCCISYWLNIKYLKTIHKEKYREIIFPGK